MTPTFKVIYYHNYVAFQNLHIACFDTLEEAEHCAEGLAENEYYCGIELAIVMKQY